MIKNAFKTLILCVLIAVLMTAGIACGNKEFSSDGDAQTANKIFSTSMPTPKDGTTPADHSAKDNAYYAFYAMSMLNGFETYSEGETVTKVAIANVSQKIKANRVIKGDEVYKENLSHSTFKGVGARLFVKGDNYIVHNASKVRSVDDVSWENSASKISEQAFIDKYGFVANSITGYVFNDESILNAEYLGESNGIYSFRYDLHTEKATAKLKFEMRTMAGTKTLPVFESASLIIRMNKDWLVTETQTNSVYRVDMLGGVTCTENVTERFFSHNQAVAIPYSDFFYGYVDSETVEPVPEQKTASDYLLDGFSDYITGTKPIKAQVYLSAPSLNLNANGNLDLSINIEDLQNLSARLDLAELSYKDINLSNLFVGFSNQTVFLKYGELKGFATVDKISDIIGDFSELFGDGQRLDAPTGLLSNLDLASLLESATLVKDGSVVTVTLPINIGDTNINVEISLNDGVTVSVTRVNATIGDIAISLALNDSLQVSELGTDYSDLTSLLDIIDENNDITASVVLGDINADIKFNLETLALDINLGDITAKLLDKTVYLNYKGIKGKLALSDLDGILNKLAPVISDKLPTLPDFSDINTEELINSVISNLTTQTIENGLVITTSALGFNVKLTLSTNDGKYTISAIELSNSDFAVSLAPVAKELNVISDSELNGFFNLTSLLDIIDQNNDITASVVLGDINADIKFNLETLALDINLGDITAKLLDNIVYLNYKGIKGKLALSDLGGILDKLAPVIGDKLPTLPDFSAIDTEQLIKSVIDNLTTQNIENGLVITTSALGFNLELTLSTNDGKYTICAINLSNSDFAVSLAPVVKELNVILDSELKNYYNLSTLLDIIDDGKISVEARVCETVLNATINLADMTVLVYVEGIEGFIDLNAQKIYARYPGVQVSVGFEDINGIITLLTPIINKFAPDLDLSALDFDELLNADNFDLDSILSSLTVTENDGDVIITVNVNGTNINVNLDVESGNAVISSLDVTVSDEPVVVTPTQNALDLHFNTEDNYIDLKDLVTELVPALETVLLKDVLSASMTASLVSGKTTIDITECKVELKDIYTAPRANATLTLKITTAKEDGSSTTSEHKLRLVYLDPSLVESGKPNVYFTYDDTSNTDVLEGTFTTTKFDVTMDIVKQIYVNIPELQDALKPVIVPDKDGFPTLPDMNIDIAKLINGIDFNGGLLAVDVNGKTINPDFADSLKAFIKNDNGALSLDLTDIGFGGMTLNLNATILSPENGIDDTAFEYTVTNASDFSSINELLETFKNTSQQRHFNISAKLDLNAISIVNIKDKINLELKIDVINGKTYLHAKIIRQYVLGAWKDYEGTTNLYFDTNSNMIYVEYDYYEKKLGIFKGSRKQAYEKYTMDEFLSDPINNILGLLRPSDLITNLIPTDSSESNHVSTATADNTLKKYAYNGTDTFSIDLDLAPLIGDIKMIHVDIGHDQEMYVNSLSATADVMGVINLSLSANLNTPYDSYLGVDTLVKEQAQSSKYN